MEIWIYMGLAWLSLFFSWNVHMVVEAHKVLKKRRHKHRNVYIEEPQSTEEKPHVDVKPNVIDIFNFLSERDDDYSTVIKAIGTKAKQQKPVENINRSKSCSDILAHNIQTLDHSPRRRRMLSTSEVFMTTKVNVEKSEQDRSPPLIRESTQDPEPEARVRTEDGENKDSCAFDSENDGITFTVPTVNATEEISVQHPDGGETRFTISKVEEENVLQDTDEKG